MRFIVLFSLILSLSGCFSFFNMGRSTVMITNSERTSGGTGVILQSGPSESLVLTNGHVCKVAEEGGLVTTDDNASYPIAYYVLSKIHDLCVISVYSDLHVTTKVSSRAPMPYEQAAIAGHPDLLPTVITTGFFAQDHQIKVMMGYRACSQDELKDPAVELLCLITGGVLPDVRTFESTLVTATIMPGSSGSAIYNSQGEIEALVFAGRGEIGYADAVPYAYIATFLSKELSTLPIAFPMSHDVYRLTNKNTAALVAERAKNICQFTKNTVIKNLCALIELGKKHNSLIVD